MRPDKVARQDKFLSLLTRGESITSICRSMGISRSTYERWRTERTFRAAVDTIRASLLDAQDELGPSDWDGTFISARKIFFGYDTYWHQREMVRAIETAEPGEVVLVLTAPETGKTTLLEDWMSIALGQDPNHRITYVSESQVRTRKIASRLQRRMTQFQDYGAYISRFGPFYVSGQEREGKPWAADYFTVNKASHDERDYSFEGRGWRSAVAGTRTDTMLIDDVQSLRSLNQTADIIERLRQDFFSRPGKNGRIIIVMTRVGMNDVPEQLWETGIVSERNTVRLPMLDGEGKSLCPEMWTEDDLAKKRLLVGEAAWWRNYMQKPQFATDATFTQAMIDGVWDYRELGQSDLPNRVAMLDPALAGGNALGVAAYNAERFEMLDFDYRFNVARVEDILVGIDRMAGLYGFQDLIIEINAYQRGLVEDERLKDLARTHGFRIRPHQTTSNKNDSDLGVARMASSFIRSEIRWPGTPAAQEKFRPMAEQHLNWRPDVPTRRRIQDLVMMSWFGWLFWTERRRTMGASTTLLQTNRALPYQPTGLPTGTVVRRPLSGIRR